MRIKKRGATVAAPCVAADRRRDAWQTLQLGTLGAALVALLWGVGLPAWAGALNDTGSVQCEPDDNNYLWAACSQASTGDASRAPGQDARYGRDAAAALNLLSKQGGGAAGFDYTRVCWNGADEGSAQCGGTLVANTGASPTATPQTDWACTRDNVTGLLWSLQQQPAMSWTDARAPAVAELGHNAVVRCGQSSGWRLPTRRELLSIVHSGRTQAPVVDVDYLPVVTAGWYWSADPYAIPHWLRAWSVSYSTGETTWGKFQTETLPVLLVRALP